MRAAIYSRARSFFPGLLFSFILTACSHPAEFEATGEIAAVDAPQAQLSIKHGGIAGLTVASPLQVAAAAPGIIGDLKVGDRIHFVLSQRGAQLILVKAELQPLVRPGIHDHTPHHGGVVVMVGMIHLEALATPDGRVRVYLTDVWRKPLPLDDVSGSITLNLPGARQKLPIAIRPEFIEAVGPPLTRAEINVRVELQRNDGPVDMTFQLPLQHDAIAAVGVGAEGCADPEARAGLSPRCVVRLAAPVCALAAAPAGGDVLVAGVGLGVTVWALPAMQLRRSLPPPPPIAIPDGERPHIDAVSVIAVSADSTRVVLGSENRLLVYSLADAQLLRELPWHGGAVRSAAWHPDGHSLLVASFYHAAAQQIESEDGRLLRDLPVEREGSVVAAAPSGNLVAVGNQWGDVLVWPQGAKVGHPFSAGERAVRGLAFIDDARVASVNEEGKFQVWSLQHGRQLAALSGALFPILAIDGSRRVAAFGGRDGVVELVDLGTYASRGKITWHRRPIAGLAWSGQTLISADDGGEVAVWDTAQLESIRTNVP